MEAAVYYVERFIGSGIYKLYNIGTFYTAVPEGGNKPGEFGTRVLLYVPVV